MTQETTGKIISTVLSNLSGMTVVNLWLLMVDATAMMIDDNYMFKVQ
jgi:hypothetical protein